MPDWIWMAFTFVFGCCIGSFLNVVIYRLPRDKSLISPPSACPACGRHIRFYDNIPLVSWLLLGGRCRYCKAKISAQYFIVELLTGVVFTTLFFVYFKSGICASVPAFTDGGWFIYLLHLTLLASFIAASVIDVQLWVIPVCICWFVSLLGLAGAGLGVYVLEPMVIRGYHLLPSASALTASLAAGAAIGLIVSLLLLATGVIKRSYYSSQSDDEKQTETENTEPAQPKDRSEILKEILFLLPVVICCLAAYLLIRNITPLHGWWVVFSQQPLIAGLLGSLWGYFVGCGVVWATRIIGTLAFGKEAMGLGDMHLMGAAGAVIGPGLVVIAFFAAPFFGLTWAFFQMFFKKTRKIPYGPFLSLGIFVVMILHDRIFSYWSFIRYR